VSPIVFGFGGRNSDPPVTEEPPVIKGISSDDDPAWEEGEYTTLLDGSKAYWNGSTWVEGVAPSPD
jgi:hypothetical protein